MSKLWHRHVRWENININRRYYIPRATLVLLLTLFVCSFSVCYQGMLFYLSIILKVIMFSCAVISYWETQD